MKRPCIKVYLSGAMTGLTPEQYAENFKEARKKVEEHYGEFFEKVLIIDPGNKDVNTKYGWSYEDCLEVDFDMIKKCDAIFMMKNWQQSNGANRELYCARAYNKIIIFEDIETAACKVCIVNCVSKE